MSKSKNQKQFPTTALPSPSIRRFVLLFLLFMAGMMFLLTGPVSDWIDLDGKCSWGMASLAAQFLNRLGVSCLQAGVVLNLSGASLAIKFGCNGLEAILILTAGILAFPGTWKRKGIGILLGALLLQFFNLLRIIALALAAVYFPALFEVIHVYVAQGIMIVLALSLFILYILSDRHSDGSTTQILAA